MDEHGYVLYHRIRDERPGHVRAGARRTDAIRDEEHALETYAILAVQVDASVRLDTERVKEEVVRQLRVPPYELGVKRISPAAFLLHFDWQLQRDNARRLGALRVGSVRLQLLPWKRQVGARAELSRFLYHVRVCIEGVPAHARQPETVASLFPKPSFVDDLDCDMEKPEEEECYCLWIWTPVPADIATAGTLQIEEPVLLPQAGYAESLMELGMPMGVLRIESAKTLDYDVLIHVDRVLDYTPVPRRPPQSSLGSEEPEPQWPASYPFPWRLGVQDGPTGRRTGSGRVSVHDRLGGAGRDRSPPRGGGSSGLGLRQVPPSGPHDMGAWLGGGRTNAHQGSSSRQGGGQYRRREQRGAGTAWQWRPKAVQSERHGWRVEQSNNASEEEAVLHMPQSQIGVPWMDPMVDEAGAGFEDGRSGSARQQCSVEPTAANEDSVLPVPPHALQDDSVGSDADSISLNGALEGTKAHLQQADRASVEMDAVDSFLPSEKLADLDAVHTQAGQEKITVVLVEAEGTQVGQTEKKQKGSQADADPPEQVEQQGQTGPNGPEIVEVMDGAGCELVHVDPPGVMGHDLFSETPLIDLDPALPSTDMGQMGADNAGQMLGYDLNVALFDLNVDCAGEEQDHSQGQSVAMTEVRPALESADGRLNIGPGRVPSARMQTRGLARFMVPLKKSLLCAPVPRARATAKKKTGGSGPSGHGQVADKAKGNPDDKATAALMRAAGVLGEDE
ncbi:unnamed protein product [Urochloa decumbens]|uniref:Uncharacterized protein n=1 Tax=Urochloa decumbens TaxID=240449 RepID=A0ABC8Z073_9POAL